MAGPTADGPVEAVRVGPGDFILAAEQVELGTRFIVGGRTYEVVSVPRIVATQRYLANVQPLDHGGPFGAFLRVGTKQT
jgi:hypothetical protein